MSEPFQVTLKRYNSKLSWGFRLQGGIDFSIPLSIQAVVEGSIAAQSGLLAGDVVLQINDYKADILQHDEAKSHIVSSGDNVTLLIQRGSINIWKPKVTKMENLKGDILNSSLSQDPADNYIQRTSLAAEKQDTLKINFFNKAPQPFPGPSETCTKQFALDNVYTPFSAPPNDISSGPALEDFSHQKQAYSNRTLSTNQGPKQGSPKLSQSVPAGIRSVKAPTMSDSHISKAETQAMICKVCSTLIIGVFVRVKGEPLHPDCFKCTRCGKNLKNQGYYTVSGQMVCESCA